jgi:hypothetical protein
MESVKDLPDDTLLLQRLDTYGLMFGPSDVSTQQVVVASKTCELYTPPDPMDKPEDILNAIVFGTY